MKHQESNPTSPAPAAPAGVCVPGRPGPERDLLTGLLSADAMERAVRESLRAGGGAELSVLFKIDLDHLERINELGGRSSGDQFLCRAAEGIARTFRGGDLIGRVGGDEFAVLLRGRASEAIAGEKARSLLDVLQFPLGDVTLTASVGAALCRGGAHAFEQVVAAANRALHQVKQSGGHGYAVLDAGDPGSQADGGENGLQTPAVQYQTLLEYMQGGVFLADVAEEIRVTYASPSITAQLRDAPGKTNQDLLSLVYPADLPPLRRCFSQTAQTGAISDLTFRFGLQGRAWQHVRLARLSLHTDGSASVIGVVTDMTEYKRAEEKLRQSEERYRIADELSHALIWEVDLATHTLYQSVETSRSLGHSGSVYHDVPDGLLATGTIHPSSVEDFRRMYADLYAGNDSKEYTILSNDGSGGYVWLRSAFRLVRDNSGKPVRSIGIVEKMPNIGEELRRFEDELRFADTIAPSMLGVVRANLTRDALEFSSLPSLQAEGTFSGLRSRVQQAVAPEDQDHFFQFLDRENLLRSYEQGNSWLFIEYRRRTGDRSFQWINLAVNLLHHPVSGDLFAFCYFRDVDARHRLVEDSGVQAEEDSTTLLYTQETLTRLAAFAVRQAPEGSLCAATVVEISDFDRFKDRNGILAAQRLLFTLGRLCRIMIGGDVLLGHISESRFAFFRTGVASAEAQRSEVVRYRTLSRALLEQTLQNASVSFSCGFAAAEKGTFRLEELLRHATLACQIAREQPGNPVTEYADPNGAVYGAAVPAPAAEEPSARRQVLVADDDDVSRAVLRTILEQEYDVDEAEDGEQALALLRRGRYSVMLCDIQMPLRDGWGVLSAMREEHLLLSTPVIMVTADDAQDSEVKSLNLGASDVIVKPIVPEVLLSRARNIIGRQEAAAITERNKLYELRQSEYDPLTGLYNKQGFVRRVREQLDAGPDTRFLLVRWDLDNFKMINDTMGVEAGDRLLRDIGGGMHDLCCAGSLFAHLEADHFVVFLPQGSQKPEDLLQEISRWFRGRAFNYRLSVHMGVYAIDEPGIEVSVMCDRALLALKSVKASFTQRIGWYDESLRSRILEEQELSDEMVSALEKDQFVLYFQPQINYDDGSMVGAEALVRWQHPTKGLIPPAKFIPLFERNGFISTLDEYIWDKSCQYMRRWLDRRGKLLPVSVSVNISRVDIYNPRLCEHLQELVRRYSLPASYLRLEITESAYMQNPEQLISTVKSLRAAGFTVEMDDFDAGYSSLNTLKDVPVNVLKLDIRFLSKGEDDARGGSILSSVIRMAHWLDMPIIAEGVETQTQADYLKSLNCLYMQGYYFSRPLPAEKFEELLAQCAVGTAARFGTTDLKGVAAFWDPSAQTALLFNSLVGGAAILEYRDGNAEILRANDKFYSQLGTSRKEYLDRQKHTLERFSGKHREEYQAMLEEAIRTSDEAECEIQSTPVRPGGPVFWTHNRVRLLAKNADSYLFYLAVENVTARREMEERVRVSREELQLALAQMGRVVCTYDIPSHTLTLPEEYARRHGVPTCLNKIPEELEKTPLLPRDYARYRAFYADILAGRQGSGISVRLAAKGGGFLWEHYEAAVVFNTDGRPLRAVVSVEDVTARMEREAEDERNRLLLERPGTSIFDYDCQEGVLRYQTNTAGGGIRSRTVPCLLEALGQPSRRIPAPSAAILLRTIKAASAAVCKGELEFQANLWETGVHWCRMRYVSIADESGEVYRCVGQVEDIQSEREQEERNLRIAAQLSADGVPPVFDSVLPQRALELLCSAPDTASAAQRILETAGLYYGAGRAYVFRASPGGTCRAVLSWCAQGTAPRPASVRERLQGVRPARFDSQGLFLCPDASALPGRQRDAAQALGTRSVVQYAAAGRGRFCGFVGFDLCAGPAWTEAQTAALCAVARLIGIFLLQGEAPAPEN